MSAGSPLIRGHRLTASFSDSAIDVELTESFAQDHEHDDKDHITATTVLPKHLNTELLNDRIAHIARLVAENNALRGLSQDDCAAVSAYLDNIERLLEPRPDIDRTSASIYPRSSTENPKAATFTAAAAPQQISTLKATIPSQSQSQLQTSRDLNSILQELSRVNSELRDRYIESRHIHDLFILKCEGLAQRILELEEEVHELQSDVLEDTIELEGLRGTVRGLHSWVNRWQRLRESSALAPPRSDAVRRPKGKNYWKRKPKAQKEVDEHDEDGNDFDTFLDGVLAWMRGWNDVEEGFLIRARRRKLRRDRKGLGTS